MGKRQAPSFLGKPLNDELLGKRIGAKRRLGFLRPATAAAVTDLGNDFSENRKQLLELWPRVLTDAIFTLKKADKREYKKGVGLDADSLFDQASLGVQELGKLFEGFKNFEPMLYGASEERYRDHIAHPFRVWMLGHLILDECLGWDLFSEKRMRWAISSTEWKCMWAIAALCHDVGYPLEGVEMINDKARDALGALGLRALGDLRFGFSQQMMPFHDTVIRLMASKPVRLHGAYYTHLQSKYYLKYLKSFDLLRHGIISALLISKGLVYFLESDLSLDPLKPLARDDVRQFLIRREILRAIASHTCLDIYHLRFNTLPFVLYMVDEMQGWGRPTFAEARGGIAQEQETTIETFDATTLHVAVRVPQEEWNLAYNEGRDGWLARKVNNLHQIVRLAVDTPRARSLQLRVEYWPKGGGNEYARFQLRRGNIDKCPTCWFPDAQQQ